MGVVMKERIKPFDGAEEVGAGTGDHQGEDDRG